MLRRWRRRHRYNRKKSFTYLFLLLLCISLGMGYAAIRTELHIDGISKFQDASWDVHFENIQVKTGSITPTTAATITNDTALTFSAILTEPGEFYEFTVDIVNDGTIDAMIDSYRIQPVLTEEEEVYFDYIVTYSDGTELGDNQKLEAGDSETLRVAFIYKTLQDISLYPTEDENHTISVAINYVQEGTTAIDVPHPPTLYSVLEDAATVGTYAAKYTGDHQDSWANNGTKDIYHWYGQDYTYDGVLNNYANVIFAGQCWQMIRTTDTGGVKMIYNGEVENNQCLNTRGTHVGYNGGFSQTLSNDYYYGTSYEYDSTNNVFSISGTVSHGTWSGTNYEPFIGKYTCLSTSESGTCATLYLVASYYNTSKGYVISINGNSQYYQFGKLQYNFSNNSPAYVGYMYNQTYSTGSKVKYENMTSTWTINTSYYYSDTIDYGTLNVGKYTLVNPSLISTLSDYSELEGKYILQSTGTSYTYAGYVVRVNGNSLTYRSLSNGSLDLSLTLGDSYTESGGVYYLSGNVTNVTFVQWVNGSYSNAAGKYYCLGTNTSCTNIRQFVRNANYYTYVNPGTSYYVDPSYTYTFSESVSYDGTNYTLTGDTKTFWDYFDSTNLATLSTHNYTCLGNGVTTCATVNYVTELREQLYYIQLTGIANIEAALDKMLYANDVNTYNSSIKTGVEAWYARYLSPYDEFIEDTIFCNNRTIQSLGGWQSNGGNVFDASQTNYLRFEGQLSASNTDLSCDRETDQFSTLNTNAPLAYKVGLLSVPERKLLNNIYIYSMWNLLTPSSFSKTGAGIAVINSGGAQLAASTVSNSVSVHPVISLRPGIMYTSGDGSMASPYVVKMD